MKNLIYIVILIVGIVAGMLLCRQFCIPERVIETQRDTIIVRDTLVVEKPVPVKVTQKETLLVEVTDTLRVKDTLYITLPKEVKIYASDEYYAEVSGYQPSLDYLEIYQKNVVVSKTEIPKEKKNYLAVGMDASWCIKPSIPIYLEYTRMLHRNVALRAGVFHDLAINETGFRVGVNANVGW